MPVHKDADGRRWVQADVEVPGTPEEVWDAIATGPGISSWFVPTTVEGQPGGAIEANFGPGMDSHSTVTEWEPPRRYAAESRDNMGPGDPTVATEWIVEGQAGGTCIVRVVHSWFADSDDWDGQFEGHTFGWVGFFRILRVYLAHFSGQPSAAFQVMGMAAEPVSEAFGALVQHLGLVAVAPGDLFETAAGTLAMAGVVEHVGPDAWPELLLRLREPAPGVAHLFAMAMGGQVLLAIRCYLYGAHAAEAVSQADPAWQAWVAQHFPAGG